jgi:3-isopropylmalate dehydrogenase
MSKKQILILPGDGIGPEVVETARQVLQKIAEIFNHDFNFKYGLIGHSSIIKTGKALDTETLQIAKESDAILFGAVGDPSYDNNPSAKIRPEQGLLEIRKELGLFANLRPVQVFEELIDSSPLKAEIVKGTDILFFRELTGGIYFGKPRERQNNNQTAIDTMVYHKFEIQRIAKMAFEAARNRRKKVLSVDKANVLECSRLWRETVEEVAKDYPEVELSHQFIDSATMKLMTQPREYDIILTANLFGDILTDEASQIAGSLGMLASASVGSQVGLFEPIHGSAPDIANQNIANPLATILSAALLLEIGLNMKKESELIIQAVKKVLKDGYRTKDLILTQKDYDKEKVLGTKEMGQKVLERLVN